MRISDWSSDVCSSDLGHLDRVDAEGRLLVVLADAVQQLVAGGDARRARYGRQPAVAGGEHACVRIGPVGEGRHPGAAEFMQLVKQHWVASLRCCDAARSAEHTSELQSLMRISNAA